ncbi:MAG: phage tail protein [Deltaproteobacteria bacterium]|nr:phage tail protein [Deltaproteobacteria bacterium]
MPTAYQYNSDGFFVGEVEDHGLLPNNATDIQPVLTDGFIPRWVGAAWVQVANLKGKSGYLNGQPFTITEYGPAPDGWSETAPLPKLSDAQTAKRLQINAGFDAAMTASLTMPSRNNPASAVELALAIEDFKTDDPAGWADLRAIHETRRDALLAAVDAAATVEAVQAIVVSYAV